MRRIRPPDKEMASKLESLRREAEWLSPSLGCRSRCGVGMAVGQSLCWEVGLPREQKVVFQWILGDFLYDHP